MTPYLLLPLTEVNLLIFMTGSVAGLRVKRKRGFT